MKRALCIWLPAWPIQRLVVARPELSGRSASLPVGEEPAGKGPANRYTQRGRQEPGDDGSSWEQASVQEAASVYVAEGRPVAARSPNLTTRPLALHIRDPRRGRIIVASCPLAQQLGIDLRMPLAEADALHTETLFLEHDAEADHEALSELAVWCEQFSPIVGLEVVHRSSPPDDKPSCLLLDITGLEPIFGGEPRLIDLIERAFHTRGYHIRVGVGTTVGAAWALAHYGTSRGEDDLLGLPIEALRLEANTLDILQQLGIETISQLLQLPRKALATRLGEALLDRIDQLLGKKSEVIVAHRAAPHFEVEWQLEHPTRRRDAMEKILEELSLQLSNQLVQHDHAVVQAEATLLGKSTRRTLTISLLQPSHRPQHLSDLLKLQAETVQFADAIHCVKLAATATVRVRNGQQTLWEDLDAYTGQGAQREIGHLVDRLSSRLGRESVFGVCAQAGALPEKSYRRKPLTSTLRKRTTKSAPTLKAPHRPLHLYEPPVCLGNSVRDDSARKQKTQGARPNGWASPPVSFQFQNQSHTVVQHWGPERIETGWWHGRTVRRDYYRVETTEGCRFWLFRQVGDGAWFLHGSFE